VTADEFLQREPLRFLRALQLALDADDRQRAWLAILEFTDAVDAQLSGEFEEPGQPDLRYEVFALDLKLDALRGQG
jgi:hypothetical protein